LTVAYETYGVLSPQKDNAILLCHALSGDSHAAGIYADQPEYKGWWDHYVGPGKTIDTNRFFVVSSNVIGGCKGSTGPSSIDPKTGSPYGMRFPVITVGDMVRAQAALLDHLEIDKLYAVIGGSMGGMQALEWAIMYPQRVDKIISIASTSKLSPQAISFDAVGRNAIISDPNWADGDYYANPTWPEKGLSIARMIGHITYLSEASMMIKFGRNLQEKTDYGYDFSTDFQVESYLKYQGEKFVSRFDANAYLYLTKALSYFDLEKKYGSLESAFADTTCKFLVLAITSDWLYPPKQSKDIVKALMKMGKRVTYSVLDSPYGHDAFLLKNERLEQLLEAFLA
jgi:homoserine O-acetyltransferase